MISRSVRLGTPWAPGWKNAARPGLGQLITPTTNWTDSVIGKAIEAGVGVVIGTTLGTIGRLIIPSLRASGKQNRVPFLIIGGAAAVIGTLIPFQGLLVNAVGTTGGIMTGLGISSYIVSK